METLVAPRCGTKRVFYSYAECDAKHVDDLEKHLSDLRQCRLIEGWRRCCISPGAEWRTEIDRHLRESDLILPLISPDLIAAEHYFDGEMEEALRRHLNGTSRIIPILIRPVDWQNAPFAKLQALPRNGRPITTWRNRDRAWQDVARGVRDAIQCLDHRDARRDPSGFLVDDKVLLEEDACQRCTYQIVIDDIGDAERVAALIEKLMKLSKDETIKIKKVWHGSIIMEIEGTLEGFKRLAKLYDSGQLDEELGAPVKRLERMGVDGGALGGVLQEEERSWVALKSAAVGLGRQRRARARATTFTPPEQVDEFRLVAPLARGSMGQVYRAHDMVLDREVAIKFTTTLDCQHRERLLIEAMALARLHHPNVVTLYRIGSVEEITYLVSEFVNGETLDRKALPLPRERVIHIARDMASGLSAAHERGVLHRDIKPANVIVTEMGEAKLLDFGLAKLFASTGNAMAVAPSVAPQSGRSVTNVDDSLPFLDETLPFPAESSSLVSSGTPAGMFIGTPRYMAPEIWMSESASPQSDIYSLGVVLFELATGRVPYEAPTIRDLREAVCFGDPPLVSLGAADLDQRLSALINSCLRRDPAERFQTARDLSVALDQLKKAAALPPHTNPYRGLRPFHAEDSGLFFGRSGHIRAVLTRLRSDPMVLVAGDSGAGKSSLCDAGVLPAIESGCFVDGRIWRTVRISPGRHPVRNLINALIPILDIAATEIEQLLWRHRGDLLRVLQPWLSRDMGLILFVDQLEELVTQSDVTEATLLCELIGHLGDLTPGVRLLLTARCDFLLSLAEALDQHAALSQALYLLSPPSEAELREIIVGPARVAGVSFESEEMIDMLARTTMEASGGLPLLQITLAELWDARDPHSQVIRATALSAIGGVTGALTRHADMVLARLMPDQHAAALRILTRLVAVDGTRLRQRANELSTGDPAEASALNSLVSGRLLIVRSLSEFDPVYELAHEALIQSWSTLRDLLSGKSDRDPVRRRIEAASAEWVRSGRARDALLSERQLAEVHSVGLDQAELQPTARTFLSASRIGQRRLRLRRRLLASALVSLPLTVLMAGLSLQRSASLQELQQVQAVANLARQPGREVEAMTASIRLVGSRRQARKPPLPGAEAALIEAASNNRALLPPLSHQQAVRAVAFSPDGGQLVTGCQDHDARIWDAATGRELFTLRGHTGGVWVVAFSPDGGRVLTADEHGGAFLWDRRTALLLSRLDGHTRGIRDAGFSPDGTRAITAGDDRDARLWDTRTGQVLAVLTGHTATVRSARFSPDGRQVVTASADGTARIWDAASGRLISEIKGHTAGLNLALFSPDGNLIATTGRDGAVRLWEARTARLRTVLPVSTGTVRAASFSPDGSRLVTAGGGLFGRLWNVVSGAPIADLRGHTTPLLSAVFSPDGTRIVTTGSDDHQARLFDGLTGAPIASFKGHQDHVTTAVFSPDGSTIATASDDGTVRLWTAQPGLALSTLSGHSQTVWGIGFSPDGTRLVSAGGDATARLWDVRSGGTVAVLRGHADSVLSAGFSPDGSRIITASWDRTARLWDARTGASLATLSRQTDRLDVATFSPDGTRVATGGRDGLIEVWDARSGGPLSTLTGHWARIAHVAFAPDGGRLVSAGWDGTARVWDVSAGKEIYCLSGDQAPVLFAGFSPNGRTIATTGQSGAAWVWSAESGQLRHVLRGHQDSVPSAAFSPDSRRLVTASLDGTACIWDVESGARIASLRGHTDSVLQASFSPDQTRIVTAGEDHTARLWDAKTGEELGSLRGHTSVVTDAIFSPDGQIVATASADHTIKLFPATQERIYSMVCSRLKAWDAFQQVRKYCGGIAIDH